jgi:hypothetical protein
MMVIYLNRGQELVVVYVYIRKQWLSFHIPIEAGGDRRPPQVLPPALVRRRQAEEALPYVTLLSAEINVIS